MSVERFHSSQIGDPAARWITARPHNPDVNRPEAIESARQWLSECINCHEGCSASGRPATGPIISPKRLLKIQSESSGRTKVKLHLCEPNEHQRYAALSYCWGRAPAYKLTLANLPALCIDVPIKSLGQTLQDAISVAHRIGIQSLWIDALCIIQDSATDKDQEIATMDHIYRNAEFTICAATSETSTESFLQRRLFSGHSMPEVDHSMLQFPCPNGDWGTILVKESRMHHVNDQPLYKRGWTLQEHMLSSRVLIYDSWQVWWECLEGKRCDKGNPDTIVSNRGHFDQLPIHGVMGRIKRSFRDLDYDLDFLWNTWAQVVEDYTQRDLTVDSDRLPALSGLVSTFSNLWGCAYYAGLWEKKLIEGLGWLVFDPFTSSIIESYAPSWSWPSIDGQVGWPSGLPPDDDAPVLEHPVRNTKLVECRVTPANKAAPFGQVTDWSLTIEGFAQWIQWDGQQQIEAKGLDPDSRPLKSVALGAEIYPEGIVARARPDCSELQISRRKKNWNPSEPPHEWVEYDFYLGEEEAETNEITLPVLVIVISRESALMLCAIEDDTYRRIGLLEFRGETALEMYFHGCDTKKVTVV